MERLIFVDNSYVYLYELSESETGYKVFNSDGTTVISHGTKTCALREAISFDGSVELAISTMLNMPVAVREYKRKHHNKPDHCIRFFTHERDERFRIPDRKTVTVHLNNRTIILRCHYVDAYHFRVDNNTYHVYDFGYLYEGTAFNCLPEKESKVASSAYQISNGYVVLIEFGNWYRGILFNSNFKVKYYEENYSRNRSRREIREEFLDHAGVEDDVMVLRSVHEITQLVRLSKYDRFHCGTAHAS